MQKKRGISLIVLVIIIIVMIILASAIILTLNNSGIINKSNEAVFKQNAKNYQTELDLYLGEALVENTKLDAKTIMATSTTEPSIKDMIPSITSSDEAKFEVFVGELKYVGNSDVELEWCESVGIRTKNTPITQEEYAIAYAEKIAIALTYGEIKEDGTFSLKEEYMSPNFPKTIKTFVIPYGATSIGYEAFRQTDIEKIVMPDSVTSIGANAFYSCWSLKDVILSKNLTSIGESAFCDNISLESIEIPSGVKNIENYAFADCTKLKSIVLPNGIEKIAISLFFNSGLTTITIPTSVTTIDMEAFLDCPSLTTVNYMGTQAQWNNITIGEDNEDLTNANIVYNYAG